MSDEEEAEGWEEGITVGAQVVGVEAEEAMAAVEAYKERPMLHPCFFTLLPPLSRLLPLRPWMINSQVDKATSIKGKKNNITVNRKKPAFLFYWGCWCWPFWFCCCGNKGESKFINCWGLFCGGGGVGRAWGWKPACGWY